MRWARVPTGWLWPWPPWSLRWPRSRSWPPGSAGRPGAWSVGSLWRAGAVTVGSLRGAWSGFVGRRVRVFSDDGQWGAVRHGHMALASVGHRWAGRGVTAFGDGAWWAAATALAFTTWWRLVSGNRQRLDSVFLSPVLWPAQTLSGVPSFSPSDAPSPYLFVFPNPSLVPGGEKNII